MDEFVSGSEMERSERGSALAEGHSPLSLPMVHAVLSLCPWCMLISKLQAARAVYKVNRQDKTRQDVRSPQHSFSASAYLW